MRVHPLTIGFMSAGLMIGAVISPVTAEDQPNDQKPAATSTRPAEGGLQFPVLERLRSATEELKLTDEQKTKVEKMFEEARSQLKEARASANDDRQEAARKSRQVFADLRQNLTSVLDDDQKAEFRTKLRTLFTPRGHAGGGDILGRLRTAMESLTLSGDQKRQIKDILESADKKAADLREKAQGGDQDAREKLGTLLRDTRKKISDILTEHQKQQLQDALQQPTTRPQARRNSDQ